MGSLGDGCISDWDRWVMDGSAIGIAGCWMHHRMGSLGNGRISDWDRWVLGEIVQRSLSLGDACVRDQDSWRTHGQGLGSLGDATTNTHTEHQPPIQMAKQTQPHINTHLQTLAPPTATYSAHHPATRHLCSLREMNVLRFLPHTHLIIEHTHVFNSYNHRILKNLLEP